MMGYKEGFKMTKNIAVIPGDGIGAEVIPQALRVIEYIKSADSNVEIEYRVLDWGSSYFLAHGRMMPDDSLSFLKDFDAILLGAVGDRRVPDNVTLGGLLLPIRQGFDLYANVRPVESWLSIEGSKSANLVIVRENSEGEYSGAGTFVNRGRDGELAMQISVFSRTGVERVIRYAFELAKQRRGKVTSVSKGNALAYTGVLWDKVALEVSEKFPEIEFVTELVDAAALHLATRPGDYDVIVASNLYGDILSDLAAMHAGSLGMLPSANLDPELRYPSLFEPVHGSAPDIAGQGVANPVGAIWSMAMMLSHLGFFNWSNRIKDCLKSTVETTKTRDIGGNATTTEFVDALLRLLVNSSEIS